jgi:hypothetical protein
MHLSYAISITDHPMYLQSKKHLIECLFVWSTQERFYYPLLHGVLLVNTNLPSWGLGEPRDSS